MTKIELSRDMRRATGGGLITRAGLARYMGITDAHNVDRFLSGLEAVAGKYYYIPDVAARLCEAKETRQ